VANKRFDAFPACRYNEDFSGYQPGTVVQFLEKNISKIISVIVLNSKTLRTRTEMVFDMLVSKKLNHVTRLIAGENFVANVQG
jgi:hypothetical protein